MLQSGRDSGPSRCAMQETSRRVLYILLIWLLLTGKTVIRCSSGDDDFDTLPPGDGDNRPPVASDAFFQISSAGSLNAFMRATDPDGDALTYRVTAGPRLGSLRDVDSRTGQFTYLPGSAGSDSFSFKASDGRRDSNTAVISIRVGTAGSSAAVESGAAGAPPVSALMADPGDPGALWVRWSTPAGGLQRIGPDGQPGVLAPGGEAGVGPDLDTLWSSAAPTTPMHAAGASVPRGFVLASAVDAFAVRGQLSVTAGRAETRVWHSQDGGGSWHLLADALPGPANAASLLQDAERPLVWRLVLTIGGASRVLESEDGGLSWLDRISLPWPGLEPIRCGTDMLCLMDPAGSHLWRLPGTPR